MSDVLELALRDLKMVEKDEKYEVKMTEWHQPISYSKCQVCLAGSIMAKSLKVPFHCEANYAGIFDELGERWSYITAHKLAIVSNVALGNATSFFAHIIGHIGVEPNTKNQRKIDKAKIRIDRYYRTYGENRAAFFRHVKRVIHVFRELEEILPTQK